MQHTQTLIRRLCSDDVTNRLFVMVTQNFASLMIIFTLKLLEIIGTKEYRQPEWVTHMEEMREALKGENFIAIH